MLCSIRSVPDLAKAFYILKTSDISYVSGIETYKTDNLKIYFNDDMKPWCLDGEKYENNSREYTISIKNKVKMLLPSKNIDKLFTKK